MNYLWQDLIFGARMFLKTPGLTTVAVLALALGIGANTTIFSLVDALLLRPFSFSNQDRLVMVWESSPEVGIRRELVSPGNITEWRKRNQTLQELVAIEHSSLDITGGDQTERYLGYRVSPAFFATLGVKAALGRTLAREDSEQGRENVVVLKHSLWQKRFGTDPNIVGKTVILNGRVCAIIGVMPREFNFPFSGGEMWIPLVSDGEFERQFGDHYLTVIGLLKPAVTIEQADADIRRIAQQLQQEYPETNSGRTAFVNSMTADYTRASRIYMPMLIGSVVFVLLIACANVANLLLARAATRKKEIVVRMALGASRFRLIRLLLTESVLLAIVGGLVGLGLAVFGVEGLARGVPEGRSRYIPGWDNLGVNLIVFFFTLAVSILTGILFGLMPALQVTKISFNEVLKESGRGTVNFARNRLRSALVVLEITLSFILLIGAGLMVRSFINILQTDFGINPDNVITMRLGLTNEQYKEAEKRVNFYQQLLQRIAALPNIVHIGAVNILPMSGFSSSNNCQIIGQPPLQKAKQPRADTRIATPGYFDAIGTELRRGRLFNKQDNEQTMRVALVNEAFAARFLPTVEAVGQRFKIEDGAPLEIIGVVSDVMNDDINDPAVPSVYLPYAQNPQLRMTLVIRSSVNPASLVGAIRHETATLDSKLPISEVKTMQQAIDERTSPHRIMLWVLGIFGWIAFLLAMVGLYAVISYIVMRRTHEIGVRMALGAQPRDILKIVIRQGALLTIIGSVIGLAGAFALTRVLTRILYGISATDPFTFVAVLLALATSAMLACYLPARRAMNVDPMIALRYE